MSMMRSKQGFSLLEILIAIAVLGIVMAMSGQLLEHMVVGQKKQAVITINQFEASLGLEMLRNDVSNAGFGLADEFKGVNYQEASDAPATQFNNTSDVPKAIQHENKISASGYIQNSDYLVIRSPAVGMDSAAGKWTNITSAGLHKWGDPYDPYLDMKSDDYMVVIKPRTQAGGKSKLFVSQEKQGKYAFMLNDTDLTNGSDGERLYLAFGMGKTEPTMPFNRADYYVRRPDNPDEVNPNCAPGTGILYKDVIGDKDKNGDPIRPYPLIDCVANMQVVFRLDTNTDGIPDPPVNDISGLDAYKIKEQIKEVHIYILAHEGIKDKSYRSEIANPAFTVGPSASLGTVVDLSALDGSSTDAWKRYRWITYKIVVKPKSFY